MVVRLSVSKPSIESEACASGKTTPTSQEGPVSRLQALNCSSEIQVKSKISVLFTDLVLCYDIDSIACLIMKYEDNILPTKIRLKGVVFIFKFLIIIRPLAIKITKLTNF